ncbi:translocation/assembly module TamB domain-containing protein [Helicobacter ibis]|uniref:DUF3971 domain-containing protein n=1 Tax=Helicobacter ibis TaxID=2962633 RepID=A0ABT4VFK5_9HELI|nr:hypothetical protein [Helicobacter ibis]MDA3969472.1 hypothetical protein [Helicobacter ibis]
MKLKLVILFFVSFLILTPLVLFSSIGNKIVSNIAIAKLSKITNTQWYSNSFTLSPTSILVDFSAYDGALELFLNVEYSLFLRNIDGNFFINSKGFKATINNKQYNVSENEWIEGKLSGKFNNYTIISQSNFLQSNSDIIINGNYLNISHLTLSTKEASLLELLKVLNQKPYSDGIITMNADVTIKDSVFGGVINMQIDGGEVNRSTMEEEFSIKIPRTSFAGDLKAIVDNNTLEHELSIYSTIGDITLNGVTNIHSLNTNTQFDIQLENIAPLSPLFKVPLNGYIKSSGTSKGDSKNMMIVGDLGLKNSKINYELSLNNLKPKNLIANASQMDPKDIFTLFNKEAYFDGSLDLSLNLRDFNNGISGAITLNSDRLFINSPLLEERTKIGFPSSLFKLRTNIDLANGNGIIRSSLNSQIANIESENGKISIKPFNIEIPLKLEIEKIQNISYNNKSLLNGHVQANGKLTNNDLTIQGDILQKDSKNPFMLSNTKQGLNLRLNNINTKTIQNIFPQIPKILNGTANMHLNLDLATNTKNINFDINKAKFNNTNLSKEINKHIKPQLTNLLFSGYIYSTIQNNTIQSRMQLKSDKITLNSQKITTNLDSNKIDGEITIANKKYIITNTINSPKITIYK